MGAERQTKIVALRIREGSRIYNFLEKNTGRPYSNTLINALNEYLDFKDGSKCPNPTSVALHSDTKTMKEIRNFMKEINLKLEPFEKVYFEFYLKIKKMLDDEKDQQQAESKKDGK